jgi:hypothetical protein
MADIYRHDNADGSTEFNDTPTGSGKVTPLKPDGRRLPEKKSTPQEDHKRASELTNEIQKHGSKLNVYFEYLDYLRYNNPIKFDRVMADLKRQDFDVWQKLQGYPQFKPLRETVFGHKAGQNLMGAAMGLASGNFTGSVEKWMETVLKDLMKRDRYGPYADVLGSKATTLPAPKPPTYSNSRLGQYMKTEDARLAEQAKIAEKELAASRGAFRGSVSTTVGRLAGPLLDLGIWLLNAETAGNIANTFTEIDLKKALSSGAIDFDQYEIAHNFMNQGKYEEMISYLKAIRENRK